MTQFQDLGFVAGTSFIMLSLGLGLAPTNFRQIIAAPRAYLVGLFCQMIMLPLAALALLTLWPAPLSAEIAIGTMFLAAAPGGVTSNLLTRFAGGDTALSISLTATTSLASAITVPVVVLLSLAYFDAPAKDVPVLWEVAFTLFLLVAVPVGSGVALRFFYGSVARRLEPILRQVSLLLLAVLLVAAFVENSPRVLEHSTQAAFVALVLNVVMMASAAAGARVCGVGRPQVITLSLECGLQSTPLAISLLLLLDFSLEYILPAAFYGGVMLLTGSALAAWLGFRQRRGFPPRPFWGTQ